MCVCVCVCVCLKKTRLYIKKNKKIEIQFYV